MLLANHSQVKAIVIDSTYSSMNNMIHQIYNIFGPLRYPFVWLTKLYAYLFLGINVNKVEPAKSLAKISIPVLLIQGDKDSQIPVKTLINCIKLQTKIKRNYGSLKEQIMV